MSRIKAVAALAFVGVVFSAGSVGSQDPFRARAEAESAARALPIGPSDYTKEYVPDQGFDAQADHAPTPIAPAAPEAEPQAPVGAAIVDSSQPKPVAEATPKPMTLVAVAQTAEQPTPKLPAPVRTALAAAVNESQVQQDIVVDEPADLRYAVAQERLFETVPQDIQGYFDLFMYVSKSNRGPMAQRMFVFQRDSDGRIIPYAAWEVSTGREKLEMHHERQVRTTTPEGIFALNPKRMYKNYFSKTYDGAPMHYAMFYDMQTNGNQTGLAIHAAVGAEKIRRLGKRDSAGCVRLSPNHAKELFFKIKNTTQGRIPAFAINERGSTDRWGKAERDAAGSLVLQDGYKAVLFVENYDGRDDVAGPVIAYTN